MILRGFRVKVRIGDIIEIKTSKGLAYALYTHKHEHPPRFGAMLRVFDRLYPSRPQVVSEIVSLPVRFTIFFPLQAALNRHLVEVVGNVPIPENLRPFPIFRDGNTSSGTNVTTWWLWDGEKEWRIGTLTPEQRKLPIRAVWNDTLLIHRIEDGWRPENES
jgi:hypothetical protein